MSTRLATLLPSWAWMPCLLIAGRVCLQSAEIPLGPSPIVPTEAEAIGPGPFPNTSVTAVSYEVDASGVTEHSGFDKDEVIFRLEGQGPIPWTLSQYGQAIISPRIGPAEEATSGLNINQDPFEVVYKGNGYQWENDKLYWSPVAAAWRPHPSVGVLLGTIRKNGQAWNDGEPPFHGLISTPISGSNGPGYSMVDGSFGRGDMDILTDKAGSASFASIDFSLAWFPYDQGWTAGYVASPSPDWQEGDWIDPAYHSSDLPDDMSGMLRWTRAFATWAVPGHFTLPGVHSLNDGMLFTTSVGSTFTRGMLIAPAPRPDGDGWDIWGRMDIEADPLYQEEANLDFAFVYIPYQADRLIGGHVRGTDGAILQGKGNYAMKRLGLGRYELRIPQKAGRDGMLLLQATGRHRINGRESEAASRDFFSYEETASGVFTIESRYHQDASTFPTEDSDFYFAWVDFNTPLAPPGSLPLPDPPTIQEQPQSVAIKEGEAISFSVIASGEGKLSYQWQHNGEDLPGAQASSLVLSLTSALDSGSYRVLVSNEGGVTTSVAATLTIHSPPIIVIQPSGVDLQAGAPLQLSVTATGSGELTYQWQFNQTPLPGQNTASLELPSVSIAEAGQYRVVVTSPGGTVISTSAVVTVQPIQIASPPVISLHPASQSGRPGSRVELTVQASGEGSLSYRWQYNGFNIPGASQAIFVLDEAQLEDSGDYQVVVSNQAGSVTSEVAQIRIVQGPAIVLSPQTQSVQAGNQVVLQVEAEGIPPLSYQWRYQGFNIPGARNQRFIIENVQAADAGSYQVVVTDGSGAQVESASALLEVIQKPLNTLRITSVSLSEGSLLIQWEAKAGRVLQAKANLADPIWRDIPGTSGQGESRQALLGEAAYYRLVDP